MKSVLMWQNCWTARHLVTSEDAPSYVATNPYISKGYRLCKSYFDCFVSLFYFHNCWTDTWTSILNLFNCATLYMVTVALGVWNDSTEGDKTAFYAFFLTCLVHAPFSIGYHLIGCSGISQNAFLFWQRADFMMIFGASIPLAYALGYHAFLEDPIFFSITLGGVILCFSYTALHILDEFDPMKRMKQLSFVVFFYLIPVIYQLVMDLAVLDVLAPRLWFGLGIIISLGVGAYAYGSHWPENVLPNFCFTSHSVMHLCINSAYVFEFLFILTNFYSHKGSSTMP